jgi:hypothetical protein
MKGKSNPGPQRALKSRGRWKMVTWKTCTPVLRLGAHSHFCTWTALSRWTNKGEPGAGQQTAHPPAGPVLAWKKLSGFTSIKTNHYGRFGYFFVRPVNGGYNAMLSL